MDNKIELRGLSKHYHSFSLDGLSFSVPKGYITGFIGRNGAGKTTTLKALLSLIHAEGELLIDGGPVSSLEYLEKVGIVMDEPFLATEWDMDLVNRAMRLGYKGWDEASFFRYLERFSISRRLKVKELSRGMRIKLMLSCALSHGADLLILDEPTSGLDPMMRDEFVDLIKEFVEDENRTVLFSTHITQDLEAVADFIVFIDEGHLVRACSKDAFVDSYRVLRGDRALPDRLGAGLTLGAKVSSVGAEVLVEKDTPCPAGMDVLSEVPTIEKIMTLYGRTK